ncbi:MAG: hypothetical protein WBQ18_13850 [Solirubrobacteraceae bacterium]
MFAAVLLTLDGLLNIIYGLAAVGGSSALEHPTHYLLGTLNSWGWIALAIGILQLAAAVSLVRGHAFGRYFGIVVGALAAIAALLDIPGSPFWSLAVFAVSIWIIHGLATYSEADDVGAGEIRLGPSEPPPLGPPPPM